MQLFGSSRSAFPPSLALLLPLLNTCVPSLTDSCSPLHPPLFDTFASSLTDSCSQLAASVVWLQQGKVYAIAMHKEDAIAMQHREEDIRVLVTPLCE